MKKLILIALFVFGLTNLHTKAQTIEINGGNLKINGNSMDFPWKYGDFISKKGLGKFSRSDLGGGNDIFTYDKNGVMLYRPPSTDRISDFNIYYGKDPDSEYKFIPKKYFKGKFLVEGFAIKANTPLTDVQKALPQYNFVKSVIDAYRGEFNSLYIYLRYDAAEKNIAWISVGKKEY